MPVQGVSACLLHHQVCLALVGTPLVLKCRSQVEAGLPVGQIELGELAAFSPLLAPGSVIHVAEILPVLLNQLDRS